MKFDLRNIMKDLAVYNAARAEASEKSKDSGQSGTALFGFEDRAGEYEITTGGADDLDDYNVDFALIAPDSQGFNLVVRKEREGALEKMPMDKLRRYLTSIVDSV